jgi:DNA-binding Xre family transcriptional regulator
MTYYKCKMSYFNRQMDYYNYQMGYCIVYLEYYTLILYYYIVFLTFNTIIMLTLNLAPIFKARGIDKPYSFLVKNGFTNFTASNILNAHSRVFRLDHIEMLCNILVCEPNDLLLFTPDKGKQYVPNNPLLKLSSDDSNSDWPNTLATMPFKELKEVTKNIGNKTDQ